MTRFEKKRFMDRWSFAIQLLVLLFLFPILASIEPIMNYWLPLYLEWWHSG